MQNYYEKLIGLLPKFENKEFYDILSQCTEIEVVEKGHCLINFQSSAKKLFMIIEGAVITDFVGSNGEKRTIMFHTEQFCPFFKSYDVFFQHKHSCYEVRATEHTVVAAIYTLLQFAISVGLILIPDTPAWHLVYFFVVCIVLAAAYVLFMKKYYYLHEEYLESIKDDRS